MVKILILDDEELDLFIASKLLSLEFEVQGFTSLPEALQWVQQNSFDIVLIDYYLGTNLYAYDALKQILAVKPDITKAFVLSSHVDDSQYQELKKVGFKDVIEKPITLEKFKQYCLA